jgi:hypothetical protein
MKMCANHTLIAAVLRQLAGFFIDKSPCAPWAGRFIGTEMRRLLVSRVSRYPEEDDEDNKNKPNADHAWA